MADALDLQGVEEARHGGVVEAGALAAHGRSDLRGSQGLPARLARVLDAAIRVADQSWGWSLPLDGPLERLERDRGRASRPARRPADDLAGVRGSRTAARASRPSRVRTQLRSPSQTWFGRAASKLRPMRLGAIGWPCRLSVTRTRRGPRPPGPAAPPAASAAPPGGVRRAGRGPGAWPGAWRGHAAPRRCPRSLREPRGWRRAGRGSRSTVGSRGVSAMHGTR